MRRQAEQVAGNAAASAPKRKSFSHQRSLLHLHEQAPEMHGHALAPLAATAKATNCPSATLNALVAQATCSASEDADAAEEQLVALAVAAGGASACPGISGVCPC